MEQIDDFISAIADGIDVETAAYLVGLSPMAVFRLLEKGKNEQERLSATTAAKPKAANAGALDLWVKVAAARAKAIAIHTSTIRRASAEGDWKAAKFALENLNPGIYKNSTNTFMNSGNNEIEGI